MRNLLLALALTFSLSLPSQAFDWCAFMHLNCPPPAQSLATIPDSHGSAVPVAVPPNQKEQASYTQAFQLREYLNLRLTAQILPGDDGTSPGHQDGAPGIYTPLFTGPGIEAPSTLYKGVRFYFLHYRWDNGANLNVGLNIQQYQAYPGYPEYVLSRIAAEANTTIKGAAPTNSSSTAVWVYTDKGRLRIEGSNLTNHLLTFKY